MANYGRLTQKKNWQTTEEENYTYDSLGRLATAYTTGPQWGLSFVYDGFGNRLQQNVTKGTAPSTVQTVDPLTNRLNGAGFGYDSNGNMTGWSTPSGSVTASYDVENRMTQIVTPSVTETYAYGPGNLRVKKYQGGAWTYTVYGQGGEVLGTYSVCTVSSSPFLCQAKLRVYFGGRLVVNGWTGVKPDRLGSPDGTHGRVYPYGEVSGSVSVDQDETFTTYKRDVYTGLDYAQNRYYASAWGRFTTADPYRASGGPASPGSWNRYAYVEGDPANFADPGGTNRMAPDSPDVINGCMKSQTTWDELACRQNGGQMESGGGGGSFFDVTAGMPAAMKASYESYDAMVTGSFIDGAARSFSTKTTFTFEDGTTYELYNEGEFGKAQAGLADLLSGGETPPADDVMSSAITLTVGVSFPYGIVSGATIAYIPGSKDLCMGPYLGFGTPGRSVSVGQVSSRGRISPRDPGEDVRDVLEGLSFNASAGVGLGAQVSIASQFKSAVGPMLTYSPGAAATVSYSWCVSDPFTP